MNAMKLTIDRETLGERMAKRVTDKNATTPEGKNKPLLMDELPTLLQNTMLCKIAYILTVFRPSPLIYLFSIEIVLAAAVTSILKNNEIRSMSKEERAVPLPEYDIEEIYKSASEKMASGWLTPQIISSVEEAITWARDRVHRSNYQFVRRAVKRLPFDDEGEGSAQSHAIRLPQHSRLTTHSSTRKPPKKRQKKSGGPESTPNVVGKYDDKFSTFLMSYDKLYVLYTEDAAAAVEGTNEGNPAPEGNQEVEDGDEDETMNVEQEEGGGENTVAPGIIVTEKTLSFHNM
jgi:hypothetical protein